jgi:hypothetical protein
LADTATVTVRNHDPGHTVKGTGEMRKTAQSHKVLILDPAAGTGTFLYAVVDHIRQQYMTSGNAGMWSGYVGEHLLPRLFGFELLMAPYAVAHFKLALQLAGYDLTEAQRALWAYDFAAGERIRVYLTNALEGPTSTPACPSLPSSWPTRPTPPIRSSRTGRSWWCWAIPRIPATRPTPAAGPTAAAPSLGTCCNRTTR